MVTETKERCMMSHEIETMAYAGQVPWHGLGTYVGENDVLSQDMLRMSGLDWTVSLKPIYASMGEGWYLACPGSAVVRDSDSRVLGVVGKRFSPLQNADCFTFLDCLVEEGQMKYHTAGSLRDGQRVWCLGKVGQQTIVPDDHRDDFILLYNGHDGSTAVRCLWTSIRVVCANTARAALAKGKKDGVYLKHTLNLSKRIHEAKKALGLALRVFDASAEFERALARAHMNHQMWETFRDQLIPFPRKGDQETTEEVSTARAQAKRDLLDEILVSWVGQDIPTGIAGCLVRDTLYGARNAVTAYVNYSRQSKGEDEAGAQANRFESSLFGSGARLIEQADDLLVDMLQAA